MAQWCPAERACPSCRKGASGGLRVAETARLQRGGQASVREYHCGGDDTAGGGEADDLRLGRRLVLRDHADPVRAMLELLADGDFRAGCNVTGNGPCVKDESAREARAVVGVDPPGAR